MKETSRWYSTRLQQDVTVVRWGHFGTPVLLFPTAGGDAEECERFLMINALAPLLDGGRIKVYAVDSVAGRAWVERQHSARHCSWLQGQFDAFIHREVVPAVRMDCRSESVEIMTAGASIGAFNAVAALCRHPDIFSTAIAMSGTFDLTKYLHGGMNDDFYFSSPLHFLPNLDEGRQLARLRRRFVVLPCGQGRWESPEESWRMANVLGAKGIPNRVDLWDTKWDHDWPTWREMLPRYLDDLA